MNHIAEIVQIKQQNPDTSIFDIIIEYCQTHEEEFDIDDFIGQLRGHKGFKEFVKRDMVEFNFCKHLHFEDIFRDLF